MAINLEKGKAQDISISKLRIGLGWEPNEDKSDYPYDLDVSAFLLGTNNKLLSDSHLVFYNSELRVSPDNLMALEPISAIKYPSFNEEGKLVDTHEHWRRKTRPVDPDFSVYGSIDDMEGEVSDGGDDETMNVDLKKLNQRVQQIIITVSIYEFSKRRQNFGQVDDSYISIYNEVTNELLYKYELNEDFSTCTAVEFVKIYRQGTQWKVEAMGAAHNNGLQSLVDKYV